MESRKLEISGAKRDEEEPLAATYRQLPAEDMDDQGMSHTKNTAKNQNGGPEADGADEKMLPDDNKIAPNISAGDVKFISNEKQNGDAKIDIGELKTAFVAMGKEELMKYANDPFWVRLRWFLFIFFWLLWAGMLVGAILIIVAAPKCAQPQPRTWWEEGPLTEIKDLDVVSSEDLKKFKQDGVKGVIAEFPLDPYLGIQSAEFDMLLKNAKEVDMNVIVGIEPGFTSKFFNDSESKDDAYLNYYIWKDPTGKNETGDFIPPNNWVSTNDHSAWIYSTARKQFYLAPFGKPMLDFRNPKVEEEFSKILKRFLDAGAKGFRLVKVPYLLVDPNFQNEHPSESVGYTLGQYGFYNHDKTMNSEDLGPLLKKWKAIIRNSTETGVLMLSDDITTMKPFKVNNTVVIDLPKISRVFNKTITSGLQFVSDLNSTFDLLEGAWPIWENNVAGLSPDVVDVVTFTLPGTTLIPYNYTVNKELVSYRKLQSIMHGGFEKFVIANDTAFAFIRIASGNPGYVVALNPSDERITVDFPSETKGKITEEVTVHFLSSNYNETNIGVKIKIKANAVPISPKSSIILTYVPKNEN